MSNDVTALKFVRVTNFRADRCEVVQLLRCTCLLIVKHAILYIVRVYLIFLNSIYFTEMLRNF